MPAMICGDKTRTVTKDTGGTGVTFAPTSESHSPLPQWESLGVTTIWCQINQPPSTIIFLSYQILFSHVGMTLATLQPLTYLWPYAHSNHSRFIGVGGKHSTYIIRIEALCSQQPFRVLLGWGGGGNILLTSSALQSCYNFSCNLQDALETT